MKKPFVVRPTRRQISDDALHIRELDVLADFLEDLFVPAFDAQEDVPAAVRFHVTEQFFVDGIDPRLASPREMKPALRGEVEDLVDPRRFESERVVRECDFADMESPEEQFDLIDDTLG